MTEQKRRYDASRRHAQAEQTRLRALTSAAQRFARSGYEATTLADIAAGAEVSVEYLQRIGTKAAIFRAAMEYATLPPGDSVADARARLDELEATGDPRALLNRVATVTTDWNQRSYGLWRAWAGAADPDLQAAWDGTMADVRAQWATHLQRWAPHGWLRTDLPVHELAAGVWLLTIAETYERLVIRAGMSAERYRDWLERSLADLLIARDP